MSVFRRLSHLKRVCVNNHVAYKASLEICNTEVLTLGRVSFPESMRYGRMIMSGCSFNHNIEEFIGEIFRSPDLGALASQAKSRRFVSYYQNLHTDDKIQFLKILSQHYDVDQTSVVHVAQNVVAAQERGDAILLKTEERMRNALIPRYHVLFSKIGRIEGGVKFLVDMRADVLNYMVKSECEIELAYLKSLDSTLKELLSLWFCVGFLNLERVTWTSPCDIVQKISDYEAVHPIRNWADLKRRVGPYRRCFVFQHNSMPREPVVVLHTALTNEISSNIHSIIKSPGFRPTGSAVVDDGCDNLDEDTTEEDPNRITTAMFYSITSTQKGLQGVDLGNYLIKTVANHLKLEFPGMTQFSSLSPIQGFRDWLITEINQFLHMKNAGEHPEQNLLFDDDIELIRNFSEDVNTLIPVLETLKRLLLGSNFCSSEDRMRILERPLMRLCARYLYLEKRRGYALNPVANFHLGNGAVLWRLNWMADMSIRGLTQSFGIMVNYRYFLEETEENSRNYLEGQYIKSSQQIIELSTGYCKERESPS